MKQYAVKFTVKGIPWNCTEMETETHEVKIHFYKHPNGYGNGFGMVIKGGTEPFGLQSYDIRYDKRFDPKHPALYIHEFYETRFNGENGAWTLLGISIEEADAEEADAEE